jgi:hypothetical protein
MVSAGSAVLFFIDIDSSQLGLRPTGTRLNPGWRFAGSFNVVSLDTIAGLTIYLLIRSTAFLHSRVTKAKSRTLQIRTHCVVGISGKRVCSRKQQGQDK